MAYEVLFQEHDIRLKKIATVFSCKTRWVIERDEFYQTFAVRLIQLADRYPDTPQKDFIKMLNWALHNRGCDLMVEHFSLWPIDPLDNASNKVLEDGGSPGKLFRETVMPSFLFLYREACLEILETSQAKLIFDWLMRNAQVIDKFRDERNVNLERNRRVTLRDIIRMVRKEFDFNGCETRRYIREIRNSLRDAELTSPEMLSYGLAV